jgi:NAD kinase
VSTNPLRAVFVTRESDYQLLLRRHATREQARFFLKTHGQSLEMVEKRHSRFFSVLQTVRAGVPAEWRQTEVSRSDFDRFLFGPEDIVIAVGQDGLVANVSKYLSGQPVIGVNPDPMQYDGVLVRFAPEDMADLLPAVGDGQLPTENLTMADARLEDGTRLRALNEIFVGHRSHQSARYEILANGQQELHSSSGVIVATGTGSSGWARSIMEATGAHIPLAREEKALCFFVREAFPSVATGTSIRSGRIDEPGNLVITSRMNEGGVIFADGIEQHYVPFDWGQRVELRAADVALNLVVR